MDKNLRDIIYSNAIRNHSFTPSWKSIFAWPKCYEPNDEIFWSYYIAQIYPTLAVHNSFIIGSNVFHLSNIIYGDKMN
jgi:hypothetical protein